MHNKIWLQINSFQDATPQSFKNCEMNSIKIASFYNLMIWQCAECETQQNLKAIYLQSIAIPNKEAQYKKKYFDFAFSLGLLYLTSYIRQPFNIQLFDSKWQHLDGVCSIYFYFYHFFNAPLCTLHNQQAESKIS